MENCREKESEIEQPGMRIAELHKRGGGGTIWPGEGKGEDNYQHRKNIRQAPSSRAANQALTPVPGKVKGRFRWQKTRRGRSMHFFLEPPPPASYISGQTGRTGRSRRKRGGTKAPRNGIGWTAGGLCLIAPRRPCKLRRKRHANIRICVFRKTGGKNGTRASARRMPVLPRWIYRAPVD